MAPHTSETSWKSSWSATVWEVFVGGTSGDIGFGTAAQAGPVVTLVKYLDQAIGCTDCIIDWPAPDDLYDLGETADTFRIGWGESGIQYEGWYPWWAGLIMVR